MTNLFGINITEDKKNTIFDGEVFCTQRINDYQETEIREIILNEAKLEEQSRLKFPFSLIKTLCQFGWMILATGIIKAWGDGTSFSQGYRNAPILFWACPICFVVWLVLYIVSVHLKKKTKDSSAFQQHNENSEQLLLKLKETLGIPDDAIEIDVLAERYIFKDDKPMHKNFVMTEYDNYAIFLYIRKDVLCIADAFSVWEIPFSSLHTVEFIKKRVSFPDWNKNEPYDSNAYKPYKITTNQFGHYFSRYYRLEINDIHGDFYLLIPEYDGMSFIEMTNMHVDT